MDKITGTLRGQIKGIYPTEKIGDKWQKQVFTISTNGGKDGAELVYAFELFEGQDGDKIEKFNKFNSAGNTVDVSYDLRCNENPKKEGQFFTSLSAWKVFGVKGDANAPITPTNETLDEEPPF